MTVLAESEGPMEPAADALTRLGVESDWVERSRRDLARVSEDRASELIATLADTADPRLALANWDRLFGAMPQPEVLQEMADSEWKALWALLGGSQALVHVLHAEGPGWWVLFRAAAARRSCPAPIHVEALRPFFAAPWGEFAAALRRHRHREYLGIGLADLAGWVPVDETVRELSALAGGACDAASEWARQQLRESFGELRGEDGEPIPFVILGMGKLGGGELNFSSDIDLIYLYGSDAGQTDGGPRGQLDARAFAARMGELITKALQEVTTDGFVFRVDLRLRPDGMNGPMASSLAATLGYYESYGQTWERTALLQARPVGGSVDLGEAFLREVRPFVYRRYLDFSTVADMKEMKAKIEIELGRRGTNENVKLGRGGIREIEFVVQVMQLIHGGRDERVRIRGSLPTLRRLVEHRYLPADEGEALADAYRFLRRVEHAIQIVHQRQTHSLPSDPRDRETLARRLGFRGPRAAEDMLASLGRVNGAVRDTFEKLFHEPAAETRRGAGGETEPIMASLDDPEVCEEFLSGLGFRAPQAARSHLLELRDGSRTSPARPARRRVLNELAPALLGAIRRTANPDLALENMARFVGAVGARTSFLTLLRENPPTLRMLADLFGASQFLANAFCRRPDLLDSLVRADLVRVRRTREELVAELGTIVAAAEDFEAEMDALRRFRSEEFLRIGINDLQAVLEPEEVVRQLAILAEACVEVACGIAERETLRRTGLPRLPGTYAVLGLGKLGGGELNYNSDLDLIFVFEPAEGESGVSAQEPFARFVQRLISVLQTPTREGIVYRIDTRLRPSGQSGLLVSSLEGFRRYHEASAQVWERQALIKARAMAGEPGLCRRVEEVISAFVYRRPLERAEVAEIRRLRGRMERELAREDEARVNIKTGRGGLVDVEFVVQMLQMRHGHGRPELRLRSTLATLSTLAAAGIVGAEEERVLRAGYRFLRRVENALRLAHDRPVEDLERSLVDLGAVARRLGFEGPPEAGAEAFWAEYEAVRQSVRACHDQLFDREEAAVGPDDPTGPDELRGPDGPAGEDEGASGD